MTTSSSTSPASQRAPLRPKSAYLFFASMKRPEAMEACGGNMMEAMKYLGAEWGRMSEVDKEPYQQLAAQDRNRYETECRQQNIDP